MDEIVRRFPDLNFEHVRELAAIVASERNAVAVINKVYWGASWGLACLACQVVKNRIERLDKSGTHAWLRYVKEAGMAYTVVIDGVPLRVQPDIDDIREVMPGERAAMSGVGAQMGLGSGFDSGGILRLEVAQRPGEPVDAVTLYLFNESTSVTLDCEVVYRNSYAGRPSERRKGSSIVPLARPAEDVDPTDRFEFEDSDSITANDNGRNE